MLDEICVFVDTVSEMSTEVDELAGQRSIMVETVSGISTKVDNVFLRQSFLLKL